MSIFSAHLLKSRVVLIYFVPNSNCSKIFILSSKLKLKMKSFLGSLSCNCKNLVFYLLVRAGNLNLNLILKFESKSFIKTFIIGPIFVGSALLHFKA